MAVNQVVPDAVKNVVQLLEVLTNELGYVPGIL